MTDPTPTEQAAIDAMREVYRNHPVATGRWLALLRAVPLDYCTQRAINEGAFRKTFPFAEDTGYCTLIDSTSGLPVDPDTTLYRLASENET